LSHSKGDSQESAKVSRSAMRHLIRDSLHARTLGALARWVLHALRPVDHSERSCLPQAGQGAALKLPTLPRQRVPSKTLLATVSCNILSWPSVPPAAPLRERGCRRPLGTLSATVKIASKVLLRRVSANRGPLEEASEYGLCQVVCVGACSDPFCKGPKPTPPLSLSRISQLCLASERSSAAGEGPFTSSRQPPHSNSSQDVGRLTP